MCAILQPRRHWRTRLRRSASCLHPLNDSQGMCPECNGLGQKMGVNSESFLDLDKSLSEGAVQ